MLSKRIAGEAIWSCGAKGLTKLVCVFASSFIFLSLLSPAVVYGASPCDDSFGLLAFSVNRSATVQLLGLALLATVNLCPSGTGFQAPWSRYSCCDSRPSFDLSLPPQALGYGPAVGSRPCPLVARAPQRYRHLGLIVRYSCCDSHSLLGSPCPPLHESMILSADKPHVLVPLRCK